MCEGLRGGGEFCILAGPPPSFVTLGTSIALLVPQFPHLGRAGVQMHDPGPLVTQVGFSTSLMLPHLSEGKGQALLAAREQSKSWLLLREVAQGSLGAVPRPQGAGLPRA